MTRVNAILHVINLGLRYAELRRRIVVRILGEDRICAILLGFGNLEGSIVRVMIRMLSRHLGVMQVMQANDLNKTIS